MATTSPNLSLRLPAGPDTVDVTLDLSNNFTKIDNTFNTEAPTTIGIGDAADAGTSGRVGKADHKHGGPGFATPVATGTANSAGVALTVNRSDHVHATTRFYTHGPESFDMNAGTTEDMFVFFPDVCSVVTLVLSGRLPVAGLVGQHLHSGTSAAESDPHTHTGTTTSNGGETVASAGGSSHSHTGSTSAAGSSHNHTITVDNGGTHIHSLTVNDNSGGDSVEIDGGGIQLASNDYVSTSQSPHDHTATNSAEAAHTHTLTIAADTTHTHSVTTNNHTHTFTTSSQNVGHSHNISVGSTGSGGYTVAHYPEGVTVTIDGTNRTIALGGPFGTSVSWDTGMNILPYISTAGFHTITLGCTTSGRLKSQVIAYL